MKWLIAGAFALLVGSCVMKTSKWHVDYTTGGGAYSNRNKTNADQSPATQAARDDLLGKGIDLGLIQKIEPRSTAADLWTGPMWSSSDFEIKQNTASVVHARYLTDTYHGVNIIDGRTGKRIGRFVPALGGLKLD